MNFLRRIFGSRDAAYSDRSAQSREQEFQTGSKLLAEERYVEAIERFDRALMLGFRDPDLFYSRGTCLQHLQWHLDAIDDFTVLISLEPEDCNHYFQRANSKSAVGDGDGFRCDMKQAIRLSKLPTAQNVTHNDSAVAMGWPSATALYEAHASFPVSEVVRLKRVEQARVRGRRIDHVT